MNTGLLRHAVATVLTVYGIETVAIVYSHTAGLNKVATVLTVYGIETVHQNNRQRLYGSCNSAYRLRY